jgi:DNA polymerase elongation subunit (family B)
MLKPLKRDKENCYITLDIETDNGQLLDIATYDGDQVYFFSSWDEFLIFIRAKAIEDKRYRKVVAHNGGSFDYISLAEYLEKETDYKFEVIMSQSKIVILYLFFDEVKISFIDSYNVLANSLHNLSNIFDIKHKKIEIEYDKNNMLKFKEENRDLYYEYLKYDVISLFEICKEFEKKLNINFFPTTIASLSLYLYRRHFLDRNLFSPRKKVDDFISQSYAGGRVEVFRPGKHEQVFVYDINSMYPFVMKNFEYPIGTPVKVYNYKSDYIGIYHIKFEQINYNIPAIFWEKSKENGLEFIYSGEGYYFTPEIEVALKYGVKIEFIEGYIWKNKAKLFSDFVDFYYNIRKENKSNAMGYICKLILNSLYGKFAQKERKSVLVRLKPNELKKLLDKKISVIPYKGDLYEVVYPQTITHRVIQLSALTTSYARAYLAELIMKYKDNIIYIDTDSLHLNREITENIGQELGQLKLEKSGLGTYLGRKQYMIGDNIKFKGVKVFDNLANKKLVNEKDFEMLDNGGQKLVFISYFPKLKSVIKDGRKAAKIYKMPKLLVKGKYFTHYKGSG